MDKIGMDILTFFQSIVPNLMLFIALCVLDVGLGIAASIKRKEFQWRRVADFYLSNVIAFFLGWLLFAAFGAFAIDYLDLLGESQYIATSAFVWITWAFLAASLVASIGSNFKELYGRDMAPVAK